MKYYYTIKDLIDATCNVFSERDAYIFKKGSEYETKKFGQFRDDCHKLALNLVTRGVTHAHIALIGTTSYESLVALFGSIMAANTVVIPDSNYPTETIHNLLFKTDIQYIIYQDSCKEKAEDVLQSSDFIKKMIGISGLISEPIKENATFPTQEPERAAIILFTSGTTGDSKAVVLSNQNICSNACAIADYCYAEKVAKQTENLSIAIQPIHHSMFLGFILTHMQQAFPIYFNTNIALLLEEMKTLKPTTMTVIPALVEQINQKILLTSKQNPDMPIMKAVQEVTGGRLYGMTCGSAKLNPKLCEIFYKWGIIVKEGYGMTEASPTVTISNFTDFRIGSVGKPLPGVEVKIVDGEIWTRSKCVMQGYYKDKESTEAIIQDGWLKTGDLGYLDEDGYLFITGRIKNLIILGNGENVSPEELENLLNLEQIITEALVFEKNGTIAAEIYSKTWEEYDEDVLWNQINESVRNVNGKLPSYKKIQTFQIRKNPFPKNRTQKILRTDLGQSSYIGSERTVTNAKENRNEIPYGDEENLYIKTPTASSRVANSELEKKIMDIFKRELNIDEICMTDNIFELGANSLIVRNIVYDIQYGLNIPITISAVFDHPTVEELITVINSLDTDDMEIQSEPIDTSLDLTGFTEHEYSEQENMVSDDQDNEYIEAPNKQIRLPKSELEKSLIAIFERELNLNSIQVTDNIFELGANSLIARRIIYDIQYELNIPLTISALFDHPNVMELAEIIESLDYYEGVTQLEHVEDVSETIPTEEVGQLEQSNEEIQILKDDRAAGDTQNEFHIMYPKSAVVLPVKYPIITSYTFHAHLLTILGCHEPAYEWIMSNYIQLYSYKEIAKHYFADFYFPYINQIFPVETCPWIKREQIHVSTIKMLNLNIVDFIIKAIDNNKYVDVVLNNFYLKSSIYYQQQPDFLHNVLIYGYDRATRKFYGSDFLFCDIAKYSDTEIGFDELFEAYENCNPDDANNLYQGNLFLMQIKEDVNYQWSETNIIHSISNYLEGKVPEYWDMYHREDEPEMVFGIDMYDAIYMYIEQVIEEKKNSIDHREYFVMSDHKRIMIKRCAYLQQKFSQHADSYMALGKQYEQIFEYAEQLVQLVIRFDMISAIDHITNYSILEEGLKLIEKMKEFERNALSEFLLEVK